jgi:hypothetical protein
MGQCFVRTFDVRLPVAIVGLVLFATAGNPCFAAPEADAVESAEMLSKYVDATRTQRDVLRGVQMEMDIDAKLPKLEKQGRFRALRKISVLGRITYKALGFSGDSTVKNEVITRYLAAETEARDSGSLAIMPVNYKFKYKGIVNRDGRRTAVFQISPRKKRLGLFKGELWLDAATAMPVREAGQFVKTPSIFLKKIEFVRDYELRDGVAFPTHIQSTVDTRLVGRAELSINYSNFSKQESAEDDEVSAIRADQ